VSRPIFRPGYKANIRFVDPRGNIKLADPQGIKTLPTKLSLISNSLVHMETTVFYALIIVINTFFVVSSCEEEGKISLASFDELFQGIFNSKKYI